jgi:hypothetical protein
MQGRETGMPPVEQWQSYFDTESFTVPNYS